MFPTERARAIYIANKAVKLSTSPGNLLLDGQYIYLVLVYLVSVKETTINILSIMKCINLIDYLQSTVNILNIIWPMVML